MRCLQGFAQVPDLPEQIGLSADFAGFADVYKRQDEVHFTADTAAHGFQLLGSAGADEYDLAVGVFLLDQTGGEHQDVYKRQVLEVLPVPVEPLHWYSAS